MDNKKLSVFFMMLSVLGFAFMSIVIKFIPEIALYEKVFFRNLISLMVASFFIFKNNVSLRLKKKEATLVFCRSFFGYVGVVLNFYAIIHLSIADSNILNKLSPIFVSICALIFLKEKMDKYQILAIIFMFVGALLVIKPSLSFSIIPSIAGLLSAVTAGFSYTIIRFLKDKVKPDIIVFYFSLLSVLSSIPLMFSTFVFPDFRQLCFLVGIGITASFGQYGLTYAYKFAKASEVSIYNYTVIIFGMILGYIFFKEIPDIYSFVGGILILITAYLLYKHNLKKE